MKPANVFVARLGQHVRTKVLDFGIAKVLSATTSMTRALSETGASIRAFTPQYGAPEQFDPPLGATGPWTDVYAFALMFVEVLTGKPALQGSDSMQLYVLTTDRADRPTPRARGLVVSNGVEEALTRALQVDPRARTRTLGELWSALVSATTAPVAATVFAPPRIGAPIANAVDADPVGRRGEPRPVPARPHHGAAYRKHPRCAAVPATPEEIEQHRPRRRRRRRPRAGRMGGDRALAA